MIAEIFSNLRTCKAQTKLIILYLVNVIFWHMF